MRYLPILFALFFAAPAFAACANFSTVWPACTVQFSSGEDLEDAWDSVVVMEDVPGDNEVPVHKASSGLNFWKRVVLNSLSVNVVNGGLCLGPSPWTACATGANRRWELDVNGNITGWGKVRADTFTLPAAGTFDSWMTFGDGSEEYFQFLSDIGTVTLDGDLQLPALASNAVTDSLWTKSGTPTTLWWNDSAGDPFRLGALQGNCTEQPCFDGSSDGGTSLSLYDGVSNIVTINYDSNSFNISTAANRSIFIGMNAGQSSTRTTGVVVGNLAGANLSTAQNSTFLGYAAGNATTTGALNTYLGYRAGDSNQFGVSNTVIGANAGGGAGANYSSTTMVGVGTGLALTTGSANLFFGISAGDSVTTGSNNILFNGNGNLVDGNSNIAIGLNSMTSNTGGDSNINIGVEAGQRLTGSRNINIGNSAGEGVSGQNTGSDNVRVGYFAGFGATSGSRNIFLGPYAGRWQTDSDDLFLVHNQSEANAADELTESLIVGVMSGTKANQTLRFNAVVTHDLDEISNVDSYWVGDGSGIPFGHMYTNATIAVTISGDDTPTEIGDTWTTGEVNLVTFGASHYLTVTKAGRYKIDWSMSIAQNTPGGAIQCEQGIMIGGSAQVQGRSHRTIANTVDVGASAGTAILDLAASDQISLYVNNITSTTDIDVAHANLTITMVGGT